MLQQISWSDYWKISGLLLLLYECAILLLFYRQEIALLAKRKRGVLPVARNAALTETDLSATEQEDNQDDEDENLIPFAHELGETVKTFITQAAGKGYVKEELCFGLQQRIKDYPQLNNTRYQREINTVIMEECKNQCAMHLRDSELDKLWLS